jgi:hypothetical protein
MTEQTDAVCLAPQKSPLTEALKIYWFGFAESGSLLGYTEQSAFNRAFKKCTDCTTGKYRQNYLSTK